MKVKRLLLEWLENYEKERVKYRTYQRYFHIIHQHLIRTVLNMAFEYVNYKYD